jgi:hypothetical protein
VSADGVTVSIASLSISFGDGTDYCWGAQGITGLGPPPVRNNDVTQSNDHGAVGQRDYMDVRHLGFDLTIGPQLGDTPEPEDIWALWETLRAAWATSNSDLTLTIDVFGASTLTFLGRPDGASLDTSPLLKGLRSLRVMLDFRCPDPTQY